MRFIITSLFLLILVACDQGPGPAQPTPLHRATATANPPTILGTPVITFEVPTPDEETVIVIATPHPLMPTEALQGCTPTRPDGEGPYYKPDAPERTSVGTGHLLKGMVKSTKDCAPIPGAKIEFWQVGPNAQYDDDHRATMYSDALGAYSFESNFPPAYESRPPHIHVRASAQGYQTLITQYYPADGETEGTFNLVLIPDAR
jgi:protocatechuate 3,4-dioxygenase beta subunit